MAILKDTVVSGSLSVTDSVTASKINGTPGNVIPFIVGTGTAAGTWTGTLDGLTAYYDGLIILYKSPVAGASTTTLNLNGLGAKTCYINSTTKLTTHFPINQPIFLVYSVSQNSGCWMCLDDYWVNSDTYTQALCTTAARTAAKGASMTYYTATAKSYVMVNFRYANSSASAITLNINSQGAKPIYINGTASSASNHTLPAGPYLAYYDGTNYYLRTDGKITGDITGNAATVNGLTVQTAVPANAKFTDTTYESKAAASGGTAVSLVTTGEKYTWNNKSNLAIGTTASTAMAGNTTVTNVAISANTTTNANYPVVFATSNTGTTAAKNEGVQKSGAKFYFNPSTGNVVSTKFNGLTLTAATTGFTIAGGTTSKTLTVGADYTLGAACAKGVTDNSSSTAVTSSDTNLITGRTLYYAGYTKLSIGTTASTAMAGNTNVNNVAIAANTTTNASYPVVFATSNTGTTGAKNEGLQKSGAKFYFNPSTGALNTGGTINDVDLANVVTDSGYQLYQGDSTLGPPLNRAMFSLVKSPSFPHQMCYYSNYIHEEAVVSAAAGSWTTATPPTQTIYVTNMANLTSTLVEVGLASTATSEEIDAAAAAKIMCTAQDTASITLTCYGTVPTINIPILVVNWG